MGLHQVVPMTEKTRDKIGMISCRFWAAYVMFYFLQLFEERRIINKRQTILRKKNDGEKDLLVIDKQLRDWKLNFLVNLAYFPLTLHWSVEKSYFPDLGVGICGTIAAVTQIHIAWNQIVGQ